MKTPHKMKSKKSLEKEYSKWYFKFKVSISLLSFFILFGLIFDLRKDWLFYTGIASACFSLYHSVHALIETKKALKDKNENMPHKSKI